MRSIGPGGVRPRTAVPSETVAAMPAGPRRATTIASRIPASASSPAIRRQRRGARALPVSAATIPKPSAAAAAGSAGTSSGDAA